jgi:hypothetical protein
MILKPLQKKFCQRTCQSFLAILCGLSLLPGEAALQAKQTDQQGVAADQTAPKIPDDQLDALVAPIALYPDPLLSQVLVASTYPLEIVQLQQWLGQHKDLKDKALSDAVMKEDWDPSIQAMAALPDAVKQLAENIKWTTDLGNAFLAQQDDVMDAVQRMRTKAKNAGTLKTTEQQKVETQVIETKTVVVIQQANPQIVYVPSYNPVVVYGPPIYPYPPIYYPPPSYYPAGVFIAFGVGIAIGASYYGGWGYYPRWGYGGYYGRNTININVNNNYVKHYNTNINNGNRNNYNKRPTQLPAGGNNTWQHNPQHRGAAPYSNKTTATKYGGTARGDSVSTRQTNARQQQAVGNTRQPTANNRSASTANRPATSNTAARPSNTSANRPSSGGANHIGNRQVPASNTTKNPPAFAGTSNKAAAQASSARGASSMGASRSGGGAPAGGKGRK